MNPKKRMTALAQEMLAHSLVHQGRIPEALEVSQAALDGHWTPHRALLTGQLRARLDQWEEAFEIWRDLADQCGRDNGIHQNVSDCLLRTAVHFSHREDWSKTIQCLIRAKAVSPENPLLQQVPEPGPNDFSVLMFQAGNYREAIERWEEQLKENGPEPELVHTLSIACLCLLDSLPEKTSALYLEYLEKFNIYWTAISLNHEYWTNIFENRKHIYGEKMNLETFMTLCPDLGLAKCDAKLQQLQKDGVGGLDEVMNRCAVERYSARLIAEAGRESGSELPLGGVSFQKFLFGPETAGDRLAGLNNQSIGKPGWLLKGLMGNENTVFLSYLKGDYNACLEKAGSGLNQDENNLIGLALVARLESELKGGHPKGCREFASLAPQIQDAALKQKAVDLVQKMASARLKVLIGKGQMDEAINLLDTVLTTLGSDSGPTGQGLLDSLVAAILKRSETKFNNKDVDGWLEDFDEAWRRATDKSVCERSFKKLLQLHLTTLFKDQNVKKAVGFAQQIKNKYPRMKIVQAQFFFFKALEARERHKRAGAKEAVDFFEKAYKADGSDNIIRELYSNALSNQAVDKLNGAVSGTTNAYLVKAAVIESGAMLMKALELDPKNDHARNNLQEIVKLKSQLGLGFM